MMRTTQLGTLDMLLQHKMAPNNTQNRRCQPRGNSSSVGGPPCSQVAPHQCSDYAAIDLAQRHPNLQHLKFTSGSPETPYSEGSVSAVLSSPHLSRGAVKYVAVHHCTAIEEVAAEAPESADTDAKSAACAGPSQFSPASVDAPAGGETPQALQPGYQEQEQPAPPAPPPPPPQQQDGGGPVPQTMSEENSVSAVTGLHCVDDNAAPSGPESTDSTLAEPPPQLASTSGRRNRAHPPQVNTTAGIACPVDGSATTAAPSPSSSVESLAMASAAPPPADRRHSVGSSAPGVGGSGGAPLCGCALTTAPHGSADSTHAAAAAAVSSPRRRRSHSCTAGADAAGCRSPQQLAPPTPLMSVIRQLRNLRQLDLHFCSFATDATIGALSSLTRLKKLTLMFCPVTHGVVEPLNGLTTLKSLHVVGESLLLVLGLLCGSQFFHFIVHNCTCSCLGARLFAAALCGAGLRLVVAGHEMASGC